MAVKFILICFLTTATNLVLTLRREHIVVNNVEEKDTYLTPEDFANVENFKEVDLRSIGINVHQEPTLAARKFEGDIARLNKTSIHKFINDSNNLGRAAVKDRWRIWPDGQIPYALSSRYGTYSKQVISKAFDEFAKRTCVSFVPRDPALHKDFVFIFPDDGCYSLVGRNGGRQPISLDAGCIQVGTVLHELMHSAGFFHEQSRSDRDEYIEIEWRNLEANTEDQFEKYSLRTITHLGLPYDYGSIMHYSRSAFSRNGRATIRALKPGADSMGQRDGFSDLDVQKLNKLYTCDEKTSVQHATTRAPSPKRRRYTAAPSKRRVPCEDKSWQCLLWKALGQCSTDKEQMLEKCPKRCDFCDELQQNAASAGSSTEDRSGRSNHVDDSDEASSSGGGGDGHERVCLDRHEHCAKWASLDYCTREGFAEFVQTKCPKACRVCHRAGSRREGRQRRGNGRLY